MQPITSPNPLFNVLPAPVSSREAASRHQNVMESVGVFAANELAADVVQREPDPDWQPL